jgi:hypothetical protein
VLVAGVVGGDRFAGRHPPLAPATTTPPATTSPAPTSTARIPAAVQRAIPLDVQVHLGPSGLPDRFGMASDVTGVMGDCDGGPAEIRAWAQLLGETWLLAAKEPLPGRNWICWSDGLFEKGGGSIFGGHGGPSDRLKLLQASQLSNDIAGKGELAVVGGPVTRDAVRLRILFEDGRPIDLEPFDAGPQFPVRFYVGFYLQPLKTAWKPERVVAFDRAGRRIAECWTTTRQGDVCDRPPGAPNRPDAQIPESRRSPPWAETAQMTNTSRVMMSSDQNG